MTINVLRGRRAVDAAHREAASEALPIGDDRSEIFNCPACARPLAVGNRRCPGCRTRLVRGVRATSAAGFVAAGMVAGFALAAAGGAMAIAVADPFATKTALVEPLPNATAAPAAPGGQAATAAPAPSVGVPAPAAPAAAVAALERTAEMNARLAAQAPILQAALAEPSLDTFAVAGALRSMTADAAYAAGAAERLAAWDDAAVVSAGLASLYADIRATSLEALAKSLSSESAYRTAATRMLAVLAGLGPLDAASRELAAGAGVELPVVPLPGAASAASPHPAASAAPAP